MFERTKSDAGSTQNTENNGAVGNQMMQQHQQQPPAIWPQASAEVVFFHLSSNMPDYALKSHFESYGPVLDVCLHSKDPRHAHRLNLFSTISLLSQHGLCTVCTACMLLWCCIQRYLMLMSLLQMCPHVVRTGRNMHRC